MTTADILREDVVILVSRMLRSNDEVFMFGEDGLGQHGRSDQVLRGQVALFDVSVTVDDEDNPSDIHCLLKLYVTGYDSRVHGHAITDNNLKICLDMKFKQEAIDPDAWDWAHLSMQGNDYIALNLDIPKFLDWA
jgi:hypothetical protein